mmetsp:Transcript_26680/g.76871  ORF Transcript_26680/g.76871 Transcript_26680/m.76871 type:complete len:293 (-) Transcript_26680:1528-2406(-)
MVVLRAKLEERRRALEHGRQVQRLVRPGQAFPPCVCLLRVVDPHILPILPLNALVFETVFSVPPLHGKMQPGNTPTPIHGSVLLPEPHHEHLCSRLGDNAKAAQSPQDHQRAPCQSQHVVKLSLPHRPALEVPQRLSKAQLQAKEVEHKPGKLRACRGLRGCPMHVGSDNGEVKHRRHARPPRHLGVQLALKNNSALKHRECPLVEAMHHLEEVGSFKNPAHHILSMGFGGTVVAGIFEGHKVHNAEGAAVDQGQRGCARPEVHLRVQAAPKPPHAQRTRLLTAEEVALQLL